MDTLQHKPVIIHPDLPNDPLQMQGRTGYIATANLDKDDFFVDFRGGETGLYSASALLVLRSHYDIYKNLMARSERLEKQEFKDMMRISLLLQSTDHRQAADALGITLLNPRLLPLATEPLAEWLQRDSGRYPQAVSEVDLGR